MYDGSCTLKLKSFVITYDGSCTLKLKSFGVTYDNFCTLKTYKLHCHCGIIYKELVRLEEQSNYISR